MRSSLVSGVPWSFTFGTMIGGSTGGAAEGALVGPTDPEGAAVGAVVGGAVGGVVGGAGVAPWEAPTAGSTVGTDGGVDGRRRRRHEGGTWAGSWGAPGRRRRCGRGRRCRRGRGRRRRLRAAVDVDGQTAVRHRGRRWAGVRDHLGVHVEAVVAEVTAGSEMERSLPGPWPRCTRSRVAFRRVPMSRRPVCRSGQASRSCRCPTAGCSIPGRSGRTRRTSRWSSRSGRKEWPARVVETCPFPGASRERTFNEQACPACRGGRAVANDVIATREVMGSHPTASAIRREHRTRPRRHHGGCTPANERWRSPDP